MSVVLKNITPLVLQERVLDIQNLKVIYNSKGLRVEINTNSIMDINGNYLLNISNHAVDTTGAFINKLDLNGSWFAKVVNSNQLIIEINDNNPLLEDRYNNIFSKYDRVINGLIATGEYIETVNVNATVIETVIVGIIDVGYLAEVGVINIDTAETSLFDTATLKFYGTVGSDITILETLQKIENKQVFTKDYTLIHFISDDYTTNTKIIINMSTRQVSSINENRLYNVEQALGGTQGAVLATQEELQEEIDNRIAEDLKKIDKPATAIENNIAIFTNDKQVKDDGYKINDNGTTNKDILSAVGVKQQTDEIINTMNGLPIMTYKKGFDIGHNTILNTTSNTLTITRNGTQSYKIWIYNGVRSEVKIIENDYSSSITVSNIGMHYFYFDLDIDGNVIFKNDYNPAISDIQNIIEKKCIVVSAYWNGSQFILQTDERHFSNIDGMQHSYLHNTFGCRYEKGLNIGINLTGDGANINNMQFSCDGGNINDDGLSHIIPPRLLSDNIYIIYRNGTTWQEILTTNNTICLKGATYPQFNKLDNGVYSLQEIQNNNYGISYIIAVPHIDNTKRYYIIMGNNEYANQQDAELQAKIKPTISDLPMIEYVYICSIVYQVKSTFTNAVKSKAINLCDYRNTSQVANQVNADTANLQQQINLEIANRTLADVNILDLINTYTTASQVIYCDVNNGVDLGADGSKSKPFKTLAGVLASNPNFGTKQVIKFEGVGNTGGGSVSMTNTTGIYIIIDEKCELNTTITMPTGCGTIYFIGGAITANITNNSTNLTTGMMYYINQIKIQATITNAGSAYGEIVNLNDGDACNFTNLGVNFFLIRNVKTFNKILNSGSGVIAIYNNGTIKQPIEKTNGSLFISNIDSITVDVNSNAIISSGTGAGNLGIHNVNFLQTNFTTKGKISQTNTNAQHVTYLGMNQNLDETNSNILGSVSYSANSIIIQGTFAKRPSASKNAGKIFYDETGKSYISNGTDWTQIGYNKIEIDTALNEKQTQLEDLGTQMIDKQNVSYDIAVDCVSVDPYGSKSGSISCDGLTLGSGSILLVGETLLKDNGIWDVVSGVWTQRTFTKKSVIHVKNGNLRSGTQWRNENQNDFIVGTDEIYFSQRVLKKALQENQLKAGSNINFTQDNSGNTYINSTGGGGGTASTGSYFTRTITANSDKSFQKGDLVFVDQTTKKATPHGNITPGTGDAFALARAQTTTALTGTADDGRVFIGRLKTSYDLTNNGDGNPYMVWKGNTSSIHFKLGTILEDTNTDLYINWSFPTRTVTYGSDKVFSVAACGFNNIEMPTGTAFDTSTDEYVFMLKVNTTDGSLAGQGYYNVPTLAGNIKSAVIYDMTPANQYTSSGTAKSLMMINENGSIRYFILTFNSASTGGAQGTPATGETGAYNGTDPFGASASTGARVSETIFIHFLLSSTKACNYRVVTVPSTGNVGVGGATQIQAGAVNALSACTIGLEGTFATVALYLADSSGSRVYTLCFDGATYKYQSNLSFKASTDIVGILNSSIKFLRRISANAFQFMVYTRSSSTMHAYILTVYNNNVNSMDAPVLKNAYNLKAAPFNFTQAISTFYEGSYCVAILTSGTKIYPVFAYPLTTTNVGETILKITDSFVYNSTTFLGICLENTTLGQDVSVIYQGLIPLSEFTNYPQNLNPNTVFYPDGNSSITATSGGGAGGSTKALGRTEPVVTSAIPTRMIYIDTDAIYP